MTNYTCLSNVKQLQSDLSRTRLTCGLDIIKNEDQCQKWIHKNAHVYTDYATKQRLQNCDTYFDEFPVAARRPVIIKQLIKLIAKPHIFQKRLTPLANLLILRMAYSPF